MKARSLILVFICLLVKPVYSRDHPEKSASSVTKRPWLNFYLNIGGDAARPHPNSLKPYLPISINIERVVFLGDNFLLTGGLGIGIEVQNPLGKYIWLDPGSEDPLLLGDRLLLLPHHITAGISINRKKNLFIESGLGRTKIINSPNWNSMVYTLAAVRFHPHERNRMMFRIYGALPLHDLKNTGISFRYLGFSFGWSLAKDSD
jgi:hypothetical protein